MAIQLTNMEKGLRSDLWLWDSYREEWRQDGKGWVAGRGKTRMFKDDQLLKILRFKAWSSKDTDQRG